MQNKLKKKVAELFRGLREENGLTQEELAEKLGKSLSWVRRMESGNNPHYIEDIFLLLDALGYEKLIINVKKFEGEEQ